MTKRINTKYTGVFYKETIHNDKSDKYYTIRYYNKNILKYSEEGLGFHSDGITPSFANKRRADILRNILRNEGFQSLKDERKSLAEVEYNKNNTWTFDKLWAEYKEKYEMIRRKPYKGIATDESRYKLYIQPIIGKITPKDVTNKNIDSIRELIYKKKLAAQTQRNILEIVRRISIWASDTNKCAAIPFKIDMPHVNNKINECLTKEEIKKMLDVLDNFENKTIANIIKMALFTGMRRSEILNLQWNHFDLQKKTIKIINPKSGIDKSIPLNTAVETIILDQNKIKQLDSDYVFPNPQGKPYSDIRRQLNKYKKLAGLNQNFRPLHGLRQTYASFVSEAVDIYITKDLLTHSNVATTERYVNPNKKRLHQASEGVINSMIGDSTD